MEWQKLYDEDSLPDRMGLQIGLLLRTAFHQCARTISSWPLRVMKRALPRTHLEFGHLCRPEARTVRREGEPYVLSIPIARTYAS